MRPFPNCTAVLHVGTAMGYGGANSPQQVYDAEINGTRNVLGSMDRAGSVQRLVYTSSFAAISHPAPPGYAMAKTESEHVVDDAARSAVDMMPSPSARLLSSDHCSLPCTSLSSPASGRGAGWWQARIVFVAGSTCGTSWMCGVWQLPMR